MRSKLFSHSQEIHEKGLDTFFDILKQLIRKPSVVGAEHPFFVTLKRELDELGITTTLYEGVLVAQGSQPDSGLLSAHIDRHGLICTGPNEFQYAAFIAQNRGDLTGDSIAEKTYATIVERFIDQKVYAYEPWSGNYVGLGHITGATFSESRSNLLFQVAGLEHLLAGTPVAYVDSLKYEEQYVSAQLDNVLSAAIILYMYHLGYQGRAFFTAQEEAGRSWRFMLEWFKREGMDTNELLVLDTSPFPDTQSASAQHLVLRNRDANAQFSSPLHQKLERICKAKGTDFIYKDSYIEQLNKTLIEEGKAPYSIGSTEMGRIINASQNRVQGTTLQLPTTGYHTTYERVAIESIYKMIEVLHALYIKGE